MEVIAAQQLEATNQVSERLGYLVHLELEPTLKRLAVESISYNSVSQGDDCSVQREYSRLQSDYRAMTGKTYFNDYED